MSDKGAGFISALFFMLSFAGYAIGVASAWAHQPAGVIYGLMIVAVFAALGLKMWSANP